MPARCGCKGIDIARDPRAARRHVGFAPQDTGVYLPLSVEAQPASSSPGSPGSEAATGATGSTRWSRRWGCTSSSTGARPSSPVVSVAACTPPSRSSIGRRWSCSTNRRPVPTCGRAPRSSISSAASQSDGSAVVYSTHYLHEVEQLDAHVVFMDRGRVVARGALADLVRQHGSSALELTFDGRVPAVACGDGAIVEGSLGPDPDRRSGAHRRPAAASSRSGRRRRCGRSRSSGPDLESVFLARDGPPLRPRPSRAGRMSSLRRIGVIVGHELRLVAPRSDAAARPDRVPGHHDRVPQAGVAARARAGRVSRCDGRRAGRSRPGGDERVLPRVARHARVLRRARLGDLGPAPGQPGDVARDHRRARRVPRVAIGIVEFVVVLGAGVLIFDLSIRGNASGRSFPLVVAFSVCLVLLGVAATALSRTAQQASAFAFTGMVLFGAIGGAFVPFNVLPDWARAVAPVTPTYWAMRGMRSVVLDGQGHRWRRGSDRGAPRDVRVVRRHRRASASVSMTSRPDSSDPAAGLRSAPW